MRQGNGEYLPLVGDFMSFQRNRRYAKSTGSHVLVQTSAKGGVRYSLPGAAELADTFSYFPSSYLLRFRFVRPNCAREQNSRQGKPTTFRRWARGLMVRLKRLYENRDVKFSIHSLVLASSSLGLIFFIPFLPSRRFQTVRCPLRFMGVMGPSHWMALADSSKCAEECLSYSAGPRP